MGRPITDLNIAVKNVFLIFELEKLMNFNEFLRDAYSRENLNAVFENGHLIGKMDRQIQFICSEDDENPSEFYESLKLCNIGFPTFPEGFNVRPQSRLQGGYLFSSCTNAGQIAAIPIFLSETIH